MTTARELADRRRREFIVSLIRRGNDRAFPGPELARVLHAGNRLFCALPLVRVEKLCEEARARAEAFERGTKKQGHP